MQINTCKGPPHYILSGKCKLKQQWDTTVSLLHGLKSGTMMTSIIDDDVEQYEYLFSAVRSIKDSFGSFLKLNTHSPYDTVTMLPGISQRTWKYLPTTTCTKALY